MDEIRGLKKRIFGLELILKPESITHFKKKKFFQENIDTGKFSLEQVLESLTNLDEDHKDIFLIEDTSESVPKEIIVKADSKEKETPKIILYKVSNEFYNVYLRKKNEDENSNKNYINLKQGQPNKYSYGFVPANVVVRKVPEYILGTGVLGRAFVYSNYIEILDTLVGADYMEVLTHELLHIKLPHYSETQIRELTKNYMPNARYQ
ncbi:hypothetical protein GF327_05360 [Candidatus Woesearchaeota archaeon]|nr:hypothetical protein [Candidatus Woesearchaeota archaeon]